MDLTLLSLSSKVFWNCYLTDTKAGAIKGCQTLNVPYFEWHWMHVQLRHICQPQTWSHQDSQALCILDSHLPFGACSTWISARSCGNEETVQFTSHFSIYGMQAMAICLRNGFSCLNCGISRVFESWPFRCVLSMHFCMVALWLFNKDKVSK